MAGIGIVAALLLAYALLYVRSLRMEKRDAAPAPTGWTAAAAPFRIAVRRLQSMDPIDSALQRVGISLALLEGGSCPPDRLIRWAGDTLGMFYAVLLTAWLLAAASGSWAAGAVGTLVACCLPGLRVRDLGRQVEERKRKLLLELPVMLNRLLVLVNAGENVQRALMRCAEVRHSSDHPLYRELRAALSALDRGEGMTPALETFGRRCALPEVKRFVAVLLMNMRRGGEDLVPALRDLNRQMWDRRRAAAKTLGELASSRLTFPLAIIFLLIVILVGAPAIMAF
jgi:tight adherence protein C